MDNSIMIENNDHCHDINGSTNIFISNH